MQHAKAHQIRHRYLHEYDLLEVVRLRYNQKLQLELDVRIEHKKYEMYFQLHHQFVKKDIFLKIVIL